MSIDFVVPQHGQCTAQTIFSSLRPVAKAHVAMIDLSRTSWCDPAGLVAIAAIAEAQGLAGRWVHVRAPLDQTRANYLARMRLGQVLDDLACNHDIKPVNEAEGLELLELRRFEGESGAEDLASLVYDKTEGVPEIAEALHRSLGEIGQNVSQHSGRPHGYMAAVSTHNNRHFQFAVADAGRGLTENLRRVGSTDDQRSLEMVLEEQGISSTGQPGRGRGIPETRRFVTQLNGRVDMITRTAGRLALRTSSRVLGSGFDFPGTILQGSLWCP